MEQPNWMKRFYEWNRDIYQSISDRFYDGKTGLSLEDIKRKKDEYAEEYSEGCGSLKKLLSHLWEHGVETMSCCAGHANVIRYEKDTFFGRMEVSEKAAMKAKEKNKEGYYRIEEFSSPYLMFRCPEGHPTIVDDIKKNMENQGLSIEFRVDLDKWGRISIYNESFSRGYENSASQFFDAIHIAVDQVLGICEKEIKQETMEKATQPLTEVPKEKKSLSELISDASTRRKAIETSKSPVRQKESSYCR